MLTLGVPLPPAQSPTWLVYYITGSWLYFMAVSVVGGCKNAMPVCVRKMLKKKMTLFTSLDKRSVV